MTLATALVTLDGLLVAFVLVGLAVAFLAWKVGEH